MRIELPDEFVASLADAVAARLAERLRADVQSPMTVKEAAEVLRVSQRTVERMLAEGRLPRVGGTARVLVPRWAVVELANGGRAAS